MNLLETLTECLKEHSKTLSDIQWVGCKDFEIPINNFIDLASKTRDGFLPEVADDLIVVGKNFWIERQYDEFDNFIWSYKQQPMHPQQSYTLKTLSIKAFNEADFNKLISDYPDYTYITLKMMLYKK